MCEICGQYFCYPSCPSFVGKSAELGDVLFKCSFCGKRLFFADSYTIYGGRVVCESCEAGEHKENK